MEAKGVPRMWAENEYSYYFNLLLGENPEIHQRYLEEKLNAEKILHQFRAQNSSLINGHEAC